MFGHLFTVIFTGDGLFEIEIAYGSLVNMQDDLSFRPNPPWSPPGSPDDPDNQIAIFEISENDGPPTHNEIFFAYGIITMAEIGDVLSDRKAPVAIFIILGEDEE